MTVPLDLVVDIFIAVFAGYTTAVFFIARLFVKLEGLRVAQEFDRKLSEKRNEKHDELGKDVRPKTSALEARVVALEARFEERRDAE